MAQKITRPAELLFISCLAVAICLSCGNHSVAEKQAQDPFYTQTRREDLDRLPLLKPLEMYSPDGQTWFFDLPFGPAEQQDQVPCFMAGIKDSVLIVYTETISLPGESINAWFRFDLDKQTTTVYRSSEEFRSNAFNASVKLYSVNKVAAQFQKTGELPWLKTR
jgi:hypothetical protein